MTAAAISGSFADYRLVKSRSVLQLVIEIPVEGQAAAFDALGYPMPGVEIPVAIARLNEPACAPLRERPAAQSSPQHAGGGAISIDESARSSTVELAAHNGPVAGSTPAGRTSAKERYASLPVNEQAKERAGMLPSDPRFLAWVEERFSRLYGTGVVVDHVRAEQFIRDECCFGQSRKRIAEDPEAYDRFIAMETAFRIDVGELPEPR